MKIPINNLPSIFFLRAAWRSVFERSLRGVGPATYSFNYGKVHFIVVDGIIHSVNASGCAQYIGGLRESQLRFVENDLKQVPADRLVLLLMHIPPFDEGGETFHHTGRDQLFAALSKFLHTFSVSGHTRYNKQYYFDGSEGWRGTQPHTTSTRAPSAAIWWKGGVDQYELPGAMMRDGVPQGYFVVKFSGNKYVYDYRTTHYAAPEQISLYKKDNALYANFFSGNKFSKLQYRVNGGEWRPMEMSFEADPLYVPIRRRWDDTPGLPGKIPSAPVISEHLWKAAVNLSPNCVVEVTATDEYGRMFF